MGQGQSHSDLHDNADSSADLPNESPHYPTSASGWVEKPRSKFIGSRRRSASSTHFWPVSHEHLVTKEERQYYTESDSSRPERGVHSYQIAPFNSSLFNTYALPALSPQAQPFNTLRAATQPRYIRRFSSHRVSATPRDPPLLEESESVKDHASVDEQRGAADSRAPRAGSNHIPVPDRRQDSLFSSATSYQPRSRLEPSYLLEAPKGITKHLHPGTKLAEPSSNFEPRKSDLVVHRAFDRYEDPPSDDVVASRRSSMLQSVYSDTIAEKRSSMGTVDQMRQGPKVKLYEDEIGSIFDTEPLHAVSRPRALSLVNKLRGKASKTTQAPIASPDDFTSRPQQLGLSPSGTANKHSRFRSLSLANVTERSKVKDRHGISTRSKSVSHALNLPSGDVQPDILRPPKHSCQSLAAGQTSPSPREAIDLSRPTRLQNGGASHASDNAASVSDKPDAALSFQPGTLSTCNSSQSSFSSLASPATPGPVPPPRRRRRSPQETLGLQGNGTSENLTCPPGDRLYRTNAPVKAEARSPYGSIAEPPVDRIDGLPAQDVQTSTIMHTRKVAAASSPTEYHEQGRSGNEPREGGLSRSSTRRSSVAGPRPQPIVSLPDIDASSARRTAPFNNPVNKGEEGPPLSPSAFNTRTSKTLPLLPNSPVPARSSWESIDGPWSAAVVTSSSVLGSVRGLARPQRKLSDSQLLQRALPPPPMSVDHDAELIRLEKSRSGSNDASLASPTSQTTHPVGTVERAPLAETGVQASLATLRALESPGESLRSVLARQRMFGEPGSSFIELLRGSQLLSSASSGHGSDSEDTTLAAQPLADAGSSAVPAFGNTDKKTRINSRSHDSYVTALSQNDETPAPVQPDDPKSGPDTAEHEIPSNITFPTSVANDGSVTSEQRTERRQSRSDAHATASRTRPARRDSEKSRYDAQLGDLLALRKRASVGRGKYGSSNHEEDFQQSRDRKSSTSSRRNSKPSKLGYTLPDIVAWQAALGVDETTSRVVV